MAKLPRLAQRFSVRWTWSLAIGAIAIAFVVVLIILARIDQASTSNVDYRLQEHAEKYFWEAVSLAGAPIASMAQHIATDPSGIARLNDRSMVRDPLRQQMEADAVHAIWAFDAGGNRVATKVVGSQAKVGDFPLSGKAVAALFAQTARPVFFDTMDGSIIEYRGAVRPRDQGYVFAARVWRETPPPLTVQSLGYLVSIRQEDSTRLSADFAFPTNLPGKEPDAYVPVRVTIPEAHTTGLDTTARTTLVLGVFVAFLFWLIHLLSKWTIVRPMNIMLDSLKTGRTKDLEALAKNNSEFSPLAAAVQSFFRQQEELRLQVAENSRTQEALERAKERAETATRLKGEFVANISHEIRTPLSSMIGIIDLLNETRLDEEQQEFVTILSSSARNLRSIINDVLDYSKMESGNMRFERIPFDVTRLLTETGQLHRVSAQEKGLQFLVEIDPNVPATLVGDPIRLQQVLNNLVSNALKFTAEGSIKVAVQLHSETETDATVRFSVVDTGIGVPIDRQAAIFQSFTQADGSMTRIYGGTGLGLTICRTIVEMMDGQIGVKSREGKGSTFWFEVTLPKFTKPDLTDAQTILLPDAPR